MSPAKQPDCDARHNRLLGIVVIIVLAVCTGTITYCQLTINAIDARVRIAEQTDAANAVRFETIKASLATLAGSDGE